MQRSWIRWFIVFLIQILFWYFVFNNDDLSEFWYNTFTISYNKIFGRFSSLINFPIGEFFYFLILLIFIYITYKIIRGKNLNNKLTTFFLTLNLVLFFYQNCWGIVYQVEKIKINSDELKVEVDELKQLYCNYIYNTIEVRKQINSNYLQTLKLDVSNEIILDEFKSKSYHLINIKWIKNYRLINNPTFKTSYISKLMTAFGILGYYNPFTIESNLNRLNTDLKHSATIYHELAHQMGFASESEANFISYLIGFYSDIPEIKYATLFKTSFSILNNISKSDPLFAKIQLEDLPPSLKEDYEREKVYYEKFDGVTQEIFSEMNNQFLKANNQEGTISYSKYILLVNYFHKTLKR